MEKQKINPKLTDRLLILGMIAPIAVGWLLKILFVPAAEGVEISGAHIFFTIPLPLGGLPITETQVNQWLVMISLYFVCRYLTRGLKKIPDLKRQHLAEWIVEQTEKLVKSNMGEYFADFAPFIGAVLGLSAFSSLLSLTGLFPPTSDLNVTAGWAILVFFLITYYKMKCGPVQYLKSFAEPVPFLAPLCRFSRRSTSSANLPRLFPWRSVITETSSPARSFPCCWRRRCRGFQGSFSAGCRDFWEKYRFSASDCRRCSRFTLTYSADVCRRLSSPC